MARQIYDCCSTAVSHLEVASVKSDEPAKKTICAFSNLPLSPAESRAGSPPASVNVRGHFLITIRNPSREFAFFQ